MVFVSDPVSRFLPFPILDFFQWWTVIKKCKANKTFPLQVALIIVFHHSNSSPNQDISLEFPLHSTIYPKAEGLYHHLVAPIWEIWNLYSLPIPILSMLFFHCSSSIWKLMSVAQSDPWLSPSLVLKYVIVCLLPPLSLIDKTLSGSTPCSSYQNYSITSKLVLVSWCSARNISLEFVSEENKSLCFLRYSTASQYT